MLIQSVLIQCEMQCRLPRKHSVSSGNTWSSGSGPGHPLAAPEGRWEMGDGRWEMGDDDKRPSGSDLDGPIVQGPY